MDEKKNPVGFLPPLGSPGFPELPRPLSPTQGGMNKNPLYFLPPVDSPGLPELARPPSPTQGGPLTMGPFKSKRKTNPCFARHADPFLEREGPT